LIAESTGFYGDAEQAKWLLAINASFVGPPLMEGEVFVEQFILVVGSRCSKRQVDYF